MQGCAWSLPSLADITRTLLALIDIEIWHGTMVNSGNLEKDKMTRRHEGPRCFAITAKDVRATGKVFALFAL